MKLLIVLCLGTLVFSAPASQERRNIDFLWQKNQDDETPASVRPVESSTVEPKVTATKITDPRTSVPVREEEEEADVQEELREPSPTASPLNSEQAETDTESDVSDHSEQNEETGDDADSERNQESEDQTEANEVATTERAIIDTTIRVYDEEEENGKSDREEEDQKEREPQEEQVDEQEQQKSSDQEDVERVEEQQTEMDDSYQYDDASLEHQLQEVRTEDQITTTKAPESNTETTVSDVITDAGFAVSIKGVTVVLDNDTYENLNPVNQGLPSWPHGPPVFPGPHYNHGPPHHRGQHGEGHHHGGPPALNFSGPPFGAEFNGPPLNENQFVGSPPPWVQHGHHHRFHQDRPHNHRYHFKGHGASTGYPFLDNTFHRTAAPWQSWPSTTSSSEEVTPSKVNDPADQ
ncbi:ABC transporter F family member 4-like [Aedes albopictus]|uniref:Uncharacterized protein n=1 Tax=Aedes albopictus TaxID=7160 RepID=A0ABM1ZUR9_AEDAL